MTKTSKPDAAPRPVPRLSRDPWVKRMSAFWKSLPGVKPGLPIVVGVSGGLDSMVLLHLLFSSQVPRAGVIHIAHFNHGLRGRAGDRDARFCAKAAAASGLPFHLGLPTHPFGQSSCSLSAEMWAREERHEFLAGVAREVGARHLFLAHHANDQLELYLLRLLRGTVGSGQGGMRGASPSPADPTIQLMRPLLDLSRAELESWARLHALEWVEDATNHDPAILRNAIRKEIIPRLERMIAGELPRLASRIMRAAADESDFVRAAAQRWMEEEGADFEQLHPAVQRQVLVLQCERMRWIPTFEAVEFFRAHPGELRTLKPGLTVRRLQDGMLLAARPEMVEPPSDSWRLKFSSRRRQGKQAFGSWTIRWRVFPRKRSGLRLENRQEGEEWMDAGTLGGEVEIRAWRAGDRMRPLGMKGSKKLQDIWVDRKVPPHQRRSAPVVLTQKGEVVWAHGAGIAEPFKIRPGTERILGWRCFFG